MSGPLLPLWLVESRAFRAAAGEPNAGAGDVVTRLVRMTAEDKARWLDGAARIGAKLPAIVDAARRIAEEGPDVAPARALHRWVRDRIVYAQDPGDQEQFASPDVTLSRRFDDCDGKACLFVSLCLAIGIEACIRAVFDGADFVHVQALCRWPGSENEPEHLRDGWILAEFILPQVDLGEGAEARYGRAFE